MSDEKEKQAWPDDQKDEAGTSAIPLSIESQRLLILLLLLVSLAVLKVLYSEGPGTFEPDGSFYTNVAEHVRDGDGLKTDVSLYHKGYSYFPHETAIYPIWPLVLGLSARVLPMDVAAVWLPTLFFFGTLILAYFLAIRLYPGPLLPNTFRSLDAGHLLVILFGLNRHFFKRTSLPYTEGLAFFVLFLMLFRARKLFERPGAWRGLELGLWLGVLVLIRSQMFVVTLAAACTMVWAVLAVDRKVFLPVALAGVAGFLLAIAPELAYQGTFLDSPGLGSLLRFDQVRESDKLSALQLMVETKNLPSYVFDRLKGFAVAFDAYSKHGYVKGVGPYYFAAIAVIPFLFVDLVQRFQNDRLRSLRVWLKSSQNLYLVFLGLLALGGFSSLHVIHKALFAEWNFSTRHALLSIPFFFGCLLYLSRRPSLGRIVVIALLSIGVQQGYAKISHEIAKLHKEQRKNSPKVTASLVSWLETEKQHNSDLRIATTRPQRMSVRTDGIGFHWLHNGTTLEDLKILFDELGTDYLTITEKEEEARKNSFLKSVDLFDANFRRIEADVSGFVIYARAGPMESDVSVAPYSTQTRSASNTHRHPVNSLIIKKGLAR